MKKGANDLITATAAVADRQGHFVRPPKEGAIVVINVPDLDYDLATSLAANRPAAVLNGGKGATRRGLGVGTGTLVEAGIAVVDDLGPDVMDIRDGQEITVALKTGEVIRGGILVASGRTVTAKDVETEERGAREHLGARIQAQALGAAQVFENESDLLLDGVGLPQPRVGLSGRVALVVPPSADLSARRKAIRRFVGDYNPVVIGVGAGASALAQAGLRPRVLVGDPRDFDAGQMRRVRQVIVTADDGEVVGQDRLKRHSVAFDRVQTRLSDTDVAVLFAGAAGASTIVDCTVETRLEQAFDGNSVGSAGSSLVMTRLRGRLVSLQAALTLYRPRLSGWWVAALALAAILAAIGAFLFTPWGGGVIGLSAASMLILPVSPTVSSQLEEQWWRQRMPAVSSNSDENQEQYS